MMKTGKIAGVVTLATAFAIAGCAKVDIKKVPTPTQYVHWTDAMQKKSDNMKGIRFYLPRPFINVFESFPIRTDIYIADGVVSPDGKYVLIKSVKPESGLNDYMAGIPSLTKIPGRYVAVPKPEEVDKALSAHAADVEKAQKKAEQEARTIIPTGGSPQDTKETVSAPPQTVTGINQRSVTNDNAAFAFQPLRGNFDIVYMPDFEEQYVISSFAGLGNAQFVLKLGQGWSLQGFNSLTDNSELNKRMYDLIDTSIKAAKTAVSTMGGMPLPSLLAGTEQILAPHAAELTMEDEEGKEGTRPHTPVSLKIVVVHYAAKGLYPVIKPRELEERTVSTLKGAGAFNFVMDLFRSAPFFMSSSDYDPNAIQRAKQAVQNETGKFTVPVYPYQYISFNTFRYMAIEVIKTDTPPFGTLYDKTGTQGDAGDVRRGEPGITSLNTKHDTEEVPDTLINPWMDKIRGKELQKDTNFKITNPNYTKKDHNLKVKIELKDPNKITEKLRKEDIKVKVRDVAKAEAGSLNEDHRDMPANPQINVDLNDEDILGDAKKYVTDLESKNTGDSLKNQIEKAITSHSSKEEYKIPSGENAYFVMGSPSYNEDNSELSVSIGTEGKITPEYKLERLEAAIKNKANEIASIAKISPTNPVKSAIIKNAPELKGYLKE